MSETLKVVGTPHRHCFAILPASMRDRIIAQSTSTSLSGSIVLKLRWALPSASTQKTSFIGCRGDQTCDEGYIHIPTNVLQCMGLCEQMVVSATAVSSTTAFSSRQLYSSVSLRPSSASDWEIIEFNADFVRSHLLEQVDVINDKDAVPVFIGDTRVHLECNMRLRWGFVKLGPDTLIDIKPLQRKHTHTHKATSTYVTEHPSFYETQTKQVDQEPAADEGVCPRAFR